MPTTSRVTNLIRENLHPITGATSDYDPLIQQIGEASFVLIGEASHGTHVDQTRAVEPLERTPEWNMKEAGEPAETFPSGL